MRLARRRHRGGTSIEIAVLVIVLIASGCLIGYFLWTRTAPAPRKADDTHSTKVHKPLPDRANLVAYVLNGSEHSLVPVDVKAAEATTDEERARAVVQALIQYSDEHPDSDSAPLPPGTELLSLKIEDGVAVVDFNKAFAERKFWTGSEHEYLALRALVNSLTEITAITKVQIKVNGAKVESLGGHEELTAPLDRDESLLPVVGANEDSKLKAKR